MSKLSNAAVLEHRAPVFAALGDPTRLALVGKLLDRKPHSISMLSSGSKMTRQAITKHLTVLEDVGLVLKVKQGRECLYELDPKPLRPLREYLDVIAAQWDHALLNLKAFVEKD